MGNFIRRCQKIYGQRRWTVPAPPTVKLVSRPTICKIITEMCVVVSPRSYAVRSPPRVRQQCTVKSPLLLSTLVLISLYYRLGHGCANHGTQGKRSSPPIHCCDVTKPPYLFSGELCTSPLYSNRLFVYTACYRRGGQCFSVLRTRKSDVILTLWATVVEEVTSPSSDTMCHVCVPVGQVIQDDMI